MGGTPSLTENINQFSGQSSLSCENNLFLPAKKHKKRNNFILKTLEMVLRDSTVQNFPNDPSSYAARWADKLSPPQKISLPVRL